MSVALRKPMTADEFLAWEAAQELRYEFDGCEPVAMTGETAAHAALQRNLAIEIGGRLRGGPCQFFGSDLKIEVAGSIRYPDGFVTCGPVEPGATVMTDPVVIFEVLSDSTARADLDIKNREYAATPSVMRYVVPAQDRVGGTMFERIGDNWVGHLLDADSVLRMPEIGVEVSVTNLYE